MSNIGILGVGFYLPEKVRKNDFWSEQCIAKWREKAGRRLQRIRDEFEGITNEGARKAIAAMADLGNDPFQGGVERRVMPEGMLAVEMETAAARDAICRAGIDKADIGVVLSYTLCPDFINVPSAPVIHHKLGLSEKCMAMGVDAVCNSFLMQLELARDLIASGRTRYALITQCSAITRLGSSGEHWDTWFGDAATALVVGHVPEGYGIVGATHRADGEMHRALVCGIPGKRWFDDGQPITYSEDNKANFDMVAKIADRGKQVIDDCLAESGLGAGDIDFFACHQAFLWLRRVIQDYAGLVNARAVDTFKWAGTVSAANLPLVCAVAEREGTLKPGDRVCMFQGGTGMTWSSMVLRWGK